MATLDDGARLPDATGPLAEPSLGEPDRIDKLAKLSSRLLLHLVALGVGSITLTVIVLVVPGIDSPVRALLVPVFAGCAGACVAACMSVAERRAQGWEFEDGTQWPDPEQRKERFSKSMVPIFYLRPFLGASLGLFTYGAAVAGVVFTTGRPIDPAELQPAALLAFGFLAGLFAKTLIEKLRTGFSAFLSGS